MSQRTLLEINHDCLWAISQDCDDFCVILRRVLASGAREGDPEELRDKFGVRILGRRHHGDAFFVQWGGTTIQEPYTP